MKYYLLPEKGNFYKANLHSHTTVSDGKLTPRQMKDLYMANGYSIIAYTDHNVMIHHPELAEENFLPMAGMELDITQIPYGDKPRAEIRRKTCHICFVALDPTIKQICWHREKYLTKNAVNYHDAVNVDPELPNFEREYNPECINEMIKRGVENGFFVTYNHPCWSLERYPEYMSYRGMHAMEIYNHGCGSAGYDDYNPDVFDDMLLDGRRVFCSATDDTHNGRTDAFGGFNMIKAESLTYENIANALLRGDFYASQGPLIHDLYIEDGQIHIECSEAAHIAISTDRRRAACVHAKDDEPLCHASFSFSELDKYFRLTVTDKQGNHAHTQAYYPQEILKKINP